VATHALANQLASEKSATERKLERMERRHTAKLEELREEVRARDRARAGDIARLSRALGISTPPLPTIDQLEVKASKLSAARRLAAENTRLEEEVRHLKRTHVPTCLNSAVRDDKMRKRLKVAMHPDKQEGELRKQAATPVFQWLQSHDESRAAD